MERLGAIVIGGYVNGLGLLRALAARDIPVAVVTTRPYDVAHRSGWCVAHEAVADLDERPDALIALLERWARERAGWLLLPTNDEALVALSRHRDRLAERYRVAAPPWSVTRQVVDKRALLEVARAAGIDLPHRYGPAVADSVERGDLRFPVIVKPVLGYRFASRFGSKLFVARDRDELRRAVARLAGAGLEGDVFDLVPGGDEMLYAYCTYVDARGVAHDGVTVRKLRQSPPLFGVARVAEVVDEIPELRAATHAVLERIGFRGVAAAEFKRDPRDGRFRFLEVNGRSVVYNALLRRAGLDLATLAWDDLVERRATASRANGWRGAWTNLHADLLYSALYRHQRVTLGGFLAPYGRPRVAGRIREGFRASAARRRERCSSPGGRVKQAGRRAHCATIAAGRPECDRSAAFDLGADAIEQGVEAQRLAQHRRGAELPGALGLRLARGEHDDGDRAQVPPPERTLGRQELDAVHDRHVGVDDDQPRRPMREQAQRLPSARRLGHGDALGLEQQGEGLAEVAVVVDDQDPAVLPRRGRRRASRRALVEPSGQPPTESARPPLAPSLVELRRRPGLAIHRRLAGSRAARAVPAPRDATTGAVARATCNSWRRPVEPTKRSAPPLARKAARGR